MAVIKGSIRQGFFSEKKKELQAPGAFDNVATES